MSSITRPWFFPFALLLLILSNKPCFSIGGDTLSPGQSLSVNQTIISEGNIFELGFFKTNTSKIYLGIWYTKFVDRTIVWTANRDWPLSESSTRSEYLSNQSSARLEFSQDGYLTLLDSTISVWWADSSVLTSDTTEAVLLDNGNFVLRNVSEPSTLFWQSFDDPTDTWLPGAKLGMNKVTGEVQRLTSWKNSEDPAPGLFSVGIDSEGSTQLFTEWNRSQRYWTSGVWDGHMFSSVPEMTSSSFFNYSFVSNENETYFTYSLYNTSILSRLVMSSSGQIHQLLWFGGPREWNLFWSQPREQSEVYSFCGAFGIVDDRGSPFCACLPGFEPFSIVDAYIGDWSGGCVRKTPLQCENSTSANGRKDGFLKMQNMRLPQNPKSLPAADASMCKLACVQNCSCTAFAFNSPDGCSIWEGALLNLQLYDGSSTGGEDLYLKLSASELPINTGGHTKLWVIITVPVSLTILTSSFFISCLCMRMHKRTEKGSGMDLLSFDFNTSIANVDKPNAERNQWEGGRKDGELPSFCFASVSAATSNFSPANKLGEGGFGPVYKGKLLNGQEIAVKRLSKRSRQGLEEFRNETLLIAKLQHRNLVRLLGRCTEQDEYILIYEFMPNKSLDFFLFDQNKQVMLDLGTRIRIIEGIAQGLLYLHQYSRLRIIHRDLKASNVLLDSKMNPKISDFGMARVFNGDDSRANTNRIVGTYGYMSPEYAMEGRFSIKSDVFSFGVLLLEILSGKKSTSFHQHDSLNLIGHAWELWNGDQSLDLIDPKLGNPSSCSLLLRYINIGLLCVQESPTDRPTMSDIVSMLTNELAPLPTPKQPAFFMGCCVVDPNSARRSAGTCSKNTVTVSTMEGR